MRRHGKLFEKIADVENIKIAFDKARRHKASRTRIQKLVPRRDELCEELRSTLLSGNFHTSQYHTKTIYEPKERLIYVLPFYPDRVLHHAIMNILEPIWDSLFIDGCYACRKGKGQHAGSRKCAEYVRTNKYCLKLDVSKFYPSVDHAILKRILRKKIKDFRLLNLLDEIIDSVDGGKNVPIGNYLSQWFGNLYLNELDMYAKHELRIKNYERYCDDITIYSNSKQELHGYADKIRKFLLEELTLTLSKCDVFPTSQGVDFLGYRHFPKGYILVRKRTAKRIFRRMNGIVDHVKDGRMTADVAISKVASAHGWLKYANAHNMRMKLRLSEIREELDALV